MSLSCAKAFRPTMALLYCTWKLVTAETSREARDSIVEIDAGFVWQIVAAASIAGHLFQRAGVTGRSPMPLMVHSICRAPPFRAASELATAKPRSLWQWVEKMATASGTQFAHGAEHAGVFLRRGVADGIG